MPHNEKLANLDQSITIDSAGTYRLKFDLLCVYEPGNDPYINFTFNDIQFLNTPPASGDTLHFQQDFVFVSAGTPLLHFHISSSGFEMYDAYLDNVSVKKVP